MTLSHHLAFESVDKVRRVFVMHDLHTDAYLVQYMAPDPKRPPFFASGRLHAIGIAKLFCGLNGVYKVRAQGARSRAHTDRAIFDGEANEYVSTIRVAKTSAVGITEAVAKKQLSGPGPETCTLGVGCDETGMCYADAHGQPEQCGRLK